MPFSSQLSKFATLSKISATGIRCFSAVRAPVPKNLIKLLNSETKLLPQYSEIFERRRPKENDLEKLAQTTVNFLQEEEHKGCLESSSFLRSLQLLRFDSDCRGVVLQGAPVEKIPAIYFSSIMATVTGHSFWDGKESETLKDMSIIRSKVELPFHTDFRKYGGVFPSIVTILAMESKGEVKTCIVKTKDVYESLSPDSQEILSQPIFIKRSDPKFMMDDSIDKPFSIFHKDIRGDLRMFFQLTNYTFIEVDSKAPQIFSHGKDAVSEVAEVLKNFNKENIQSVSLDKGEMLIFKNDPHFRVGNSKSVREVLASVFYNNEEYNFLAPLDKSSEPSSQIRNGDICALQQGRSGERVN